MPESAAHTHLIEDIRKHAIALSGQASDYTALCELVGDARYVLIGEATHGTEEFYRTRAELTKYLIKYAGFSAVAVEGDWPDCYRANRYVRGEENLHNAHSALAEFTRFPSWMWRNEVMVEFLDWMRGYNEKKHPAQNKAGFYGLDLYSLYASIQAVIAYLEKVDPSAAERARRYYACFDHGRRLAEDPQEYGYAATFGVTPTCERQAVEQLVELRQHSYNYMKRDGFVAEDEFFYAEQNAKIVLDAEKYYREMFKGRVSSWNLRDKHMVETLFALSDHLSKQRDEQAKIVVWAHNSHVGDARATEMGTQGEWNIGQLVREAHGNDSMLIGFSTYRGTVTAASNWDGPAQQKIVLPAMKESYEALFHEVGIKDFLLVLRGSHALNKHLDLSRLQRAIGVLYLPETERQSHYYFSKLPEQFDAIIHLDTTHALKPLEEKALWHKGEMLETYPTGM
jgi:erythromycin esterase-like protein